VPGFSYGIFQGKKAEINRWDRPGLQDQLERMEGLEKKDRKENQESRESLVPMLLFQALLVPKETGEMLGKLETRDPRDLEAKKDKQELGLLG